MKLYRMFPQSRGSKGGKKIKMYLARYPFGDGHTHEGLPGGRRPVGPHDDPGPEIWWTAKSSEDRGVTSNTVDGIHIEGTMEP